MSALALWWPSGVTQAVTHRVEAAATAQADVSRAYVLATTPQDALQAAPLPDRLNAAPLEKSRFDPFVGVQPPPPPAPKVVAAPVVEAPAPPPPPPTLNYRYLGQMTDPSGQQYVYLAKPDKDVPVTVGTRLDEGYVVEAITADAVRVVYPPLDSRAVIPIPPSRDPASP